MWDQEWALQENDGQEQDSMKYSVTPDIKEYLKISVASVILHKPPTDCVWGSFLP